MAKTRPVLLKEGSVQLYGYDAHCVSRQMPVFYNPAMEINRDLTVLVVQSIKGKGLHVCDALAGTGVRSLRLLAEISPGKIASLVSNDINPRFPALMKRNMKLNGIPSSRVLMQNRDASQMLLESEGFDYIDIDPFGSPNPFLDAACKRLGRHGVLAVTATDTSALCGSAPAACRRKYWAVPRHDVLMHEAGLRILIRKIQLVAAQYEKALVPLYSYSYEHHMRVFLQCTKKKADVDEVLAFHAGWDGAGPLWKGVLADAGFARAVEKACMTKPRYSAACQRLASVLRQESAIAAVGFLDVHEVGRSLQMGNLPKVEEVIKEIQASGSHASRTHLSGTGIRTDMEHEKVKHIIGRLAGR